MNAMYLLIKPAGASCNMRCKYCFYADVSTHREIENFGMMSVETMHNVIGKAIDYTQKYLTIAFQGGEPTLRGLDFYKEVISFVNSRKKSDLSVVYAIQTNGINVNKEWAKFFYENNFLVGLSIDGIKDTHDKIRVDSKNKGTFYKTMEIAELFDKYRVEYNILTVVNALTAPLIKKIYKFYLKRGFVYQQFIPCLDELGKERGQNEYSLTPATYETFLKERFDLWYENLKNGKQVLDRYFENFVMILKGMPAESCGMSGYCGIQTVVEADGSVYPCDFYVLDEYKLGNFNDNTMLEINRKRENSNFYQIGSAVSNDCKTCNWYFLCRGGCRRDRIEDTKKNYYCIAIYNFLEYSYSRLKEIAESI